MYHPVKDVRRERDWLLVGLFTVLHRLDAITARRQAVIAAAASRVPGDLECCQACGCLCLPAERCPGCMAARMASHPAVAS